MNIRPPVLLYDGDCPLCRGALRWLERLGLTRAIMAQSWQEAGIAEETHGVAEERLWGADAALGERIRREILLRDLASGEVRGGIDALTALLALHPGWRWLVPALQWRPMKALLGYFYNLIALNRRILSPVPPQAIPCACDPPDDPAARRQLYALLGLIIMFNTWIFALAGAPRLLPAGDAYSPLHTLSLYLLLEMLVWLPCFLDLLLGRRSHSSGIFQQALLSTALGSLLLLPGALLLRLFQPPHQPPQTFFGFTGVWISLIFSVLLFALRARTLQWPRWIPVAAFAGLLLYLLPLHWLKHPLMITSP